jgi:hypothetical protein
MSQLEFIDRPRGPTSIGENRPMRSSDSEGWDFRAMLTCEFPSRKDAG